MEISIDNLPNDAAELKKILIEQASRIQEHKDHIQYLEELVRLFQYKRYAPKSEKWPGQSLLFNETESAPEAEVTEQDGEESSEKKNAKRGKRQPLPKHIPRLDRFFDLSAEEKQCACGCDLKEIGSEISEQLDIIPAVVQVIRNIRKKYCCPKCDGAFKTAAMPPQPIPKSQASPGLLAFVATAKYADAMPLYRQENIFNRIGADIPRNTLASWMIKTADLLTPIVNLLRDKLFEGSLIQMDETPVQVLKEKTKAVTSQKYMWVQARGDPGEKVILFHYDPSRGAEVAKSLLAGFKGRLLTDGYEAYRSPVAEYQLLHHACWDHARRKFHEAVKAQAKGRASLAQVALNYIGQLYKIEADCMESTSEQRRQARGIHSNSILEQMRGWLDSVIDTVPPKSATGKALHYLDGQWEKLTRFHEDGNVPISNQLAENAIRPFAIGRKNWLFSDTPRGAHASATLYSIIETAKANGIEPYHYLVYVLTEIPKAERLEDFEALLPSAVRKKLAN